MNITELTARWLQESLGVFNEETLELYRGLLDNHVIPAFGDRETVSREEILSFREGKAPEHIEKGPRDPEATPYRIKLEEIYAVEGWEAVPTLEKMCSRITTDARLHLGKSPAESQQASVLMPTDARPFHVRRHRPCRCRQKKSGTCSAVQQSWPSRP